MKNEQGIFIIAVLNGASAKGKNLGTDIHLSPLHILSVSKLSISELLYCEKQKVLLTQKPTK